MKRNTKVIIIALIMLCVMGITVTVAQARASALIDNVSATVSRSGTKITASASIYAYATADQIAVTSIKIQEDRSGSWVTVATSSGTLKTNAISCGASLSYTGIAGNKYRTTASFKVVDAGVTETRSATSGSVTAN